MVTIVQYPCSQFDYLTSGRTESEVHELFEAWMAAHHPALLETDTAIPRWEPASYPPFDLQQDTVIIPPCCESFWSDEWEKQTAGCTLIRNTTCRDDIVAQILAARNCTEHSFDDEFVADCYAFALARFLFALITKNLYYIQTPDEQRLKSLMTEALQAVRDEQPDAVQKALQSAFDEVVQAKDNYHPTQNYFIELYLAAKTTLGEPLRQLLNENKKINLFLPSNELLSLPETNPDTFSLLKSKSEQGEIHFILDDTAQQPLSLLPILDAADSVLAGISVYRELLNVSPTVFGRLTGGLSPILPQLLKLSEMKGAIHFSPLTGWRIKEEEQSKIIWQGTNNISVDALVRYPIDASAFLGFFELAEQLGTQMGNDHAPTSVLALFPGQKSEWLETLRRMTQFTTGLGKFADIEEYFNDTAHVGNLHRFGYEKYPLNALADAEHNPISQWNELYRNSLNRQVQSSLDTLSTLLMKTADGTQQTAADASVEVESIDGSSESVRRFVEAVLPSSQLNDNGNTVAGSLLPSAVCRLPSLIVNPLSFARKVFASGTAVDVPPLGYAFVEFSPPTSESIPKKGLLGQFFGSKNEPILARQTEEDLGRNEKRKIYLLENKYFSAKFDALTGSLRSIFTNRSRFNQLSQQIAFYRNQVYSIQSADDIVMTKSSADIGQIKISGRLLFPDGEVAARYTELVTIRSQSRLLEFDVTLEPMIEFDADRWSSYLAVRYAWNDDTYEQRGGLNDRVHVLPDRKHLHSPKFIDLRHDASSLTLLTEGLPFHRRSGNRQLDTLLITQGELHRQFRLGIGVNMPNPVFVSHDFLLPQDEYVIPLSYRPKNPSAWLFQIESKNVMALHWEPLHESGECVGVMVYLQETMGRRAHFVLRAFLPPKYAAAMNFQGKELKTFKIQDDAVLIDMQPHELLPLMIKTKEE